MQGAIKLRAAQAFATVPWKASPMFAHVHVCRSASRSCMLGKLTPEHPGAEAQRTPAYHRSLHELVA